MVVIGEWCVKAVLVGRVVVEVVGRVMVEVVVVVLGELVSGVVVYTVMRWIGVSPCEWYNSKGNDD
jgi:uncharacterized protein (DUF697 family)